MKIITVYSTREADGSTGAKCLVWPDSAMVRSGKPVFLRKERGMGLVPGISVRICAVGKSIRPRFASRYYDGVAPLAIIADSRQCGHIAEGKEPESDGLIADYSVVCGDFVKANCADGHMLNLKAQVCPLAFADVKADEEVRTSTMKCTEEAISDAIAFASRLNTLKTGDIVALLSADWLPADADSLLKMSLGENVLMLNKLK